MSERHVIDVSGMSCDGCERNVEEELQGVSGVSTVDADHEAGTVEIVVEGEVSDEAVATAVDDAGYEVEG